MVDERCQERRTDKSGDTVRCLVRGEHTDHRMATATVKKVTFPVDEKPNRENTPTEQPCHGIYETEGTMGAPIRTGCVRTGQHDYHGAEVDGEEVEWPNTGDDRRRPPIDIITNAPVLYPGVEITLIYRDGGENQVAEYASHDATFVYAKLYEIPGHRFCSHVHAVPIMGLKEIVVNPL